MEDKIVRSPRQVYMVVHLYIVYGLYMTLLGSLFVLSKKNSPVYRELTLALLLQMKAGLVVSFYMWALAQLHGSSCW